MGSIALRVAACVLSGCLLFLSCADFDIWPLSWFAMVPLLVVVQDDRCRRPFAYGWVTGLVANGGGFYWINGLLMRFGHMPLVASTPLYLLLVGYQALTFACFAWIVRRARDAGVPLPMAVLAPVAMVTMELLVPFIFPWYLAITQAWVVPVIQIADLTGPLGVTFLLVMVNGALWDLLAPRLAARRAGAAPPPWRWRPLAGAAAVVALSLGYGQVRIRQVDARRAAAPLVKVGIVQGNVGISEKWDPGLASRNLQIHQRLSAELEARGAEVLVWPETAYPFVVAREQARDFPPGDQRQIRRGLKGPLLTGAVTFGGDSPYPYNTALMLDATGRFTGRYDKNFLMAFSESIPYYEQVKWIREIIPEAGNNARGTTVATFPLATAAGTFKLGPIICLEDIIPEYGRKLVAERPNLLVNITNDAWFGRTSEPWEHMALSVFRAVEHRLDLVRAVNTGVSAHIDAAGRLLAHGPSVDPRETPGVEPFTMIAETRMLEPGGSYQSLGDLFGVLNLIALLGIGVWGRRLAGRPIAWPLLGVAAAAMLAGAALASLAAAPGAPGEAIAQLLHRSTEATEESFAIGLRLAGACLLAAALAGAVLARVAAGRERPPTVELAVGVVAAMLLPPIAVGQLAGESASLVFTAAGVVAFALLGLRIGGRLRRRAAGAGARSRSR